MHKSKVCKICNQSHNSRIKGLLYYPKHIITDNIDKYITKLINKINQKCVSRLDILDSHLTYQIDQDICHDCWRFMYQGFKCTKCSGYNYQLQQTSKQCCLCKTLHCSKCERELDLFSQNDMCFHCERFNKTFYGISEMLLTFLLAILIPCLAFKYLINRFLETIDKFQYTKTQKIMAVCSFILAFPLIYALLIVVFCFIVIGYIIKSPFGR